MKIIYPMKIKLLFIAMVALFSCEEPEQPCWKCFETRVKTLCTGAVEVEKDAYELCWPEDAVKEWEAKLNYTETDKCYTLVATCKCKVY